MSLLPVNHVLPWRLGEKCQAPGLRNAVIFNGVSPTFEWCDVHESSARRSNRWPVLIFARTIPIRIRRGTQNKMAISIFVTSMPSKIASLDCGHHEMLSAPFSPLPRRASSSNGVLYRAAGKWALHTFRPSTRCCCQLIFPFRDDELLQCRETAVWPLQERLLIRQVCTCCKARPPGPAPTAGNAGRRAPARVERQRASLASSCCNRAMSRGDNCTGWFFMYNCQLVHRRTKKRHNRVPHTAMMIVFQSHQPRTQMIR